MRHSLVSLCTIVLLLLAASVGDSIGEQGYAERIGVRAVVGQQGVVVGVEEETPARTRNERCAETGSRQGTTSGQPNTESPPFLEGQRIGHVLGGRADPFTSRDAQVAAAR